MLKKVSVLLIIVFLFTLVGCSKGTKTEDNKVEYSCIKKGIQQHSKVTDDDYVEDVLNYAKLDENGKLVYYKHHYTYYYESVDRCNYWCDLKTDWSNNINAKVTDGHKRITTCSCENDKKVEEIYEYNDIPNLSSLTRTDIPELKNDNTFDLETWINKYEKINYNCK